MSDLEMTTTEMGLCPKCGAPSEYRYRIEGPTGEDRSWTRIEYWVDCNICTYRDYKRLVIPVEALHSIRYLLQPNIRVFVEKIRLVSKVKTLERHEAKAKT